MKWALIGGAAGGIALLGLLLAGAAEGLRGDELSHGLVFAIESPVGEQYLLTVAPSDGRELSRVGFPDYSMRTAGRLVVIIRPDAVRVMLSDGTNERLVHSADEGKVIISALPSRDGERVAIMERVETGGAEVVTLVELETAETVARYEQRDPSFKDVLGAFGRVWWHSDDRSITVGSGVQVEGNYEFRQSLAFMTQDGGVRVVTVDAHAAVSPDGERVLRGQPATPGCVGFVAMHELELVDLATGNVINSVREPEKGLKPVGWIVPGMGPMYTLESDAGCRPADAATTWWELPDSGEPIRQVQDPYELQRASRPSVLIEVQCGSLPRTPWGDNIGAHDLSGSGGGCKPISSPPGYVPEPANEHGWLYVGGRQVAEIARFTLIGEVEIGN